MTYKRPVRACARCAKRVITGWCWPDGFVCVSCVRHGVRRRGPCPSCGKERPLPGRDGAGVAICVDCAGITTSFLCETCGEEGELWFKRTCLACSLARRLREALDDGTGQVAPFLEPLLAALASAPEPWSGLTWIGHAPVRARLSALAKGETPLTHEGIDTMGAGQGREHLRGLLMVHGLLPCRDHHLMAFERWERDRLASIEVPSDRQVIRLYLAWRHHRDLAARAEAGRLTAQALTTARSRVNTALRLLAFLRERDVGLERCAQADLDAWFATASNSLAAVDFVRWAIEHRRCPRLVLPSTLRRSAPPPPSSSERSRIIARLLSDEGVALAERVAGLLVLLLAQPVTRVCALATTDVLDRNGEVQLRLGGAPVTLPQPVGELVREHLGDRPHLRTAAHRASPWLFPGNSPGQHLTASQLASRLRLLGVTVATRKAALHQLIGEVPAPVLADALGYHPTTAARLSAELAADWSGYAASRAAGHRTI